MKILIIFSIFIIFSFDVCAQVGIINLAPDASAALQVTSPLNDKGVLMPRLSEEQVDAIAAPATGLLVFDFSNNVLKFFDGAHWVQIGTTSQTADPTTILLKDGGDLYYNTVTNNLNYYNGAAWRKFVKTGTAL
ncbi:MAG: hypothetical protein IPO21_12575 [Bacteroidales bacterium]|nr:hypothetical protein [Bacteroidales bacterium]